MGILADPRAPSETSVVAVATATPAAGSTEVYTAQVTGSVKATGTVTFTDNNGIVCQNVPVDSSGTAVCSAQVGNEGTHTILAGYSGDADLRPSFSPEEVDVLAGPAAQRILEYPISAQSLGATLDLSPYFGTTSGLPVTYSVAAASSGVCAVSGTQLSATGAGTCTVVADQTGNENYSAAPERSESFSVINTTAAADVTVSPASAFVQAGQNLQFLTVVDNTGHSLLTNLSVTSSLGVPVTCDFTSVAVGVTDYCYATYTTTSADASAGSVTDVETVQAKGQSNQTVTAAATGVAQFQATPSVSLSEQPSVQQFTGPGQSITYDYSVGDTGNVPIDDIAVGGALGISCPATSLDPGDSETCTATYATTAADVAAAAISDAASVTASAEVPATDEPATVTAASAATVDYAGLSIDETTDVSRYPGAGFPINYRYALTNTGSVPVSIAMINAHLENGPDGNVTVTCPQWTLAPGTGETCTGS